MRFSFWFYLCKSVTVLFIVFFCLLIFLAEGFWKNLLIDIALSIILTVCFIGMVMAFVMLFRPLKMKCPFCNEYGEVGGDKAEGIYMICDNCGKIKGTGFFKTKLSCTNEDDAQ
ncbi:MAG: hypothetical protein JXR97_01605 [Planctomycetes bacterium]|nr:hypothetical protein [Planctomycetota bacterium]